MKRLISTTTRVILPAAINPPASLADTVNFSRRPSIFSRHGFGEDLGTDRCWLEVVELHAHPDRRPSLGHRAGDRVDGRLLAQSDQPGRAEHVDLSRAERTGGVLLGYH